jgi:hypothetical protein
MSTVWRASRHRGRDSHANKQMHLVRLEGMTHVQTTLAAIVNSISPAVEGSRFPKACGHRRESFEFWSCVTLLAVQEQYNYILFVSYHIL